MIVLITGASHTGKTLLAQKILDKYRYPYLSLDLLKMGLIRSRYTDLKPEDDTDLQSYLWPVVCEIVKTAIENRQNLVVEGVYIPFGWEESFTEECLKEIRYYCLVMSGDYIENHFDDIVAHACDIEQRRDDSDFSRESVQKENMFYRDMCRKYNYSYIQIDRDYRIDLDL